MQHFNEVHPHSSLGYLTPAEFAAKLRHTNASRFRNGPGAARCGGLAPRPLQHRPSRNNRKTRRRRFFQLNRGPKNQGRSMHPSAARGAVPLGRRCGLARSRRPDRRGPHRRYSWALSKGADGRLIGLATRPKPRRCSAGSRSPGSRPCQRHLATTGRCSAWRAGNSRARAPVPGAHVR